MTFSNRFLAAVTLCSVCVALICVGIVVGVAIPKVSSKAEGANLKTTPVTFVDTSSRSDNISIATALIDDGLEGMYVLDHGSGTLQCWFVNPRTGAIAGAYSTNVSQIFGGKASDMEFVMATGQVNFNVQTKGNIREAKSVCYIAENNSGKIAGYGLFYEPRLVNSGNFQTGELRPLFNQFIRNTTLKRDQN